MRAIQQDDRLLLRILRSIDYLSSRAAIRSPLRFTRPSVQARGSQHEACSRIHIYTATAGKGQSQVVKGFRAGPQAKLLLPLRVCPRSRVTGRKMQAKGCRDCRLHGHKHSAAAAATGPELAASGLFLLCFTGAAAALWKLRRTTCAA